MEFIVINLYYNTLSSKEWSYYLASLFTKLFIIAFK